MLTFQSKAWALLSVVIVGIAFSGCQKVRSPHCNKDSECSVENSLGAGVCIASQCKDCASDKDCRNGSRCNNNRCEMPCSDTNPCVSGYYCDGGFCKPECKIDEDCQFNMACVNKRCEAIKSSCSTDMDCEPGYNCVSGVCSNKMMSEAQCSSPTVVHFSFDKYNVQDGDTSVLDGAAQCLKASSSKITIEGYTDSRGTTEYNLALGQRRADSVKDFLANLGVPAERMSTISYGKERPILPQENEAQYAANRRVEIK